MAEIIETKTMKCWLREDGIVHCINHKNSIVDIESLKENLISIWKAAEREHRPVLADIRQLKKVDKDAGVYAACYNHTYMNSVGVLVGNKSSSMIGNFWLKFDEPNIPVKIFNSEEKAVKWLKNGKKNN